MGLVYMPSIINVLVYSSDGAKEASAAGFILLSMVMVREYSAKALYPTLTSSRLYGSSTSAQHPKPRTEATSTPSLYTKNNVDQRATAAPSHLTTPMATQKQRTQTPTHPKCTHPPNSTASRPHHPSQATQAVLQANNQVSNASDKVIDQHHQQVRHPQQQQGYQNSNMWATTSRRLRNTHTEQRRYTRTKQIQTTQMRSAFRNTKS